MSLRRYAYGPAVVIGPGASAIEVDCSDPDWSQFSLKVYEVAAPGCEGSVVADIPASGYIDGKMSFPVPTLPEGRYLAHVVHATLGVVHRMALEVPGVETGGVRVI